MTIGGALAHVAAAGLAMVGAELATRSVLRAADVGRASMWESFGAGGVLAGAGLAGVWKLDGFGRSIATGVALNGFLHLLAQGVFSVDRDAWSDRSDLFSFVRFQA